MSNNNTYANKLNPLIIGSQCCLQKRGLHKINMGYKTNKSIYITTIQKERKEKKENKRKKEPSKMWLPSISCKTHLLISLVKTKHINPNHTTFELCSFIAPSVWNLFPASLRDFPPLSDFKAELKAYLFRQAFTQI